MDFLKSFIFPNKMRRFRYMSVIISILIFFATSYILMFPIGVRANKNIDKFIEDNSYFTKGIYDLKLTNEDYKIITNRGYNIKKRTLGTTSDDEVVEVIAKSYEREDNQKVNVTIIFDPYNVREEEIVKVRDLYIESLDVEKPNDEQYEKALYIGKLVSVNSYRDSDFDYDQGISEYSAKSLEELKELDKKLTLFSLYNIEDRDGEDDYLIIFYPNYFIVNCEDKILGTYYRNKKDVDFTSFGVANFGNEVAVFLTESIVEASLSSQQFSTFVTVLLLPFAYVLVIWLFSRKTGALKTYKEYYNIAAISSVIPTIISFIICWFTDKGLIIYSPLSLVAFLISAYQINLHKEDI